MEIHGSVRPGRNLCVTRKSVRGISRERSRRTAPWDRGGTAPLGWLGLLEGVACIPDAWLVDRRSPLLGHLEMIRGPLCPTVQARRCHAVPGGRSP